MHLKSEVSLWKATKTLHTRFTHNFGYLKHTKAYFNLLELNLRKLG